MARRFLVNRLPSLTSYPTREQGNVSKIYPRRVKIVSDPKIIPPQTLLNYRNFKKFRKNGFISFPNVFSQQEISKIQQEVAVLCTKGPKVIEPNSSVVRSIFDVHKFEGYIKELSTNGKLVNTAKHITHDDVYIYQSQVNFQPARQGTGFGWHSDFETWHLEEGMPEMRCVICGIMLTENTKFNGALMVIPGSHNWYITTTKNNGTPTSGALAMLINRYSVKYIEGKPGTVFYFDCNLLHASHNNLMPFSRANLFFAYNSNSNKQK